MRRKYKWVSSFLGWSMLSEELENERNMRNCDQQRSSFWNWNGLEPGDMHLHISWLKRGMQGSLKSSTVTIVSAENAVNWDDRLILSLWLIDR